MDPVAVSKDHNRNVLRFRVPREHPILDTRRVQLRNDGATGCHFGTRSSRAPEPVPRWLELIGRMMTIPSGLAYAKTMVAAANEVIAEALACGDDRHAAALRGLAQRAYEDAQKHGGGTTALKAAFLQYAGATQRATASRREALLVNAEARRGRHYLIGEAVETRFGVGRLLEHRLGDDMCVVDLGYGKAVVARPELSPVLPAGAVDSLASVLPASVIASTLRGRPSGTGVTTGSASVSHASLPGGDANNNAGSSPATAASSARAQDLAHAVQAMQHERTGTTPTALERQCAAALLDTTAASVLASGQPVRATKASLHRVADAYRRRVAARSVPDAKRMLAVPSEWPTGPPPPAVDTAQQLPGRGGRKPLLFRSRRAPLRHPPYVSTAKRSAPSQVDDAGSAGAGEAGSAPALTGRAGSAGDAAVVGADVDMTTSTSGSAVDAANVDRGALPSASKKRRRE